MLPQGAPSPGHCPLLGEAPAALGADAAWLMQLPIWRTARLGRTRPPSPPRPGPLAGTGRALLAEGLGAFGLAAVVVGSGIAAQQLSPGRPGLQLLASALATALGLYALVSVLATVSGAHLNPVVSLADAALGGVSWRLAASYAAAQTAGCASGVVVANLMFSRPAVFLSTHQRASSAHLLSEALATAGLVVVALGPARSRGAGSAAATAAWVGSAYLFSSSTSFANPALAAGRMLSDTFAGIAPSSVPAFVAAEALGGAAGLALVRALYPTSPPDRAGIRGAGR
jgi:arsenate reductase